MNTSANTNQAQGTVTNTARPTRIGLRRRSMAGALLAAAITASAVGLAATAYADGGQTTQAAATQLQSQIPTPANTQRTDGPASISDNGIRMHFLVNGSAPTVLDAYKAALEGEGWTVTVANSGSWGGAGGATYTGTRGNTYGVFTGGGSSGAT